MQVEATREPVDAAYAQQLVDAFRLQLSAAHSGGGLQKLARHSCVFRGSHKSWMGGLLAPLLTERFGMTPTLGHDVRWGGEGNGSSLYCSVWGWTDELCEGAAYLLHPLADARLV